MYLLSICIPTYERQEDLQRCLAGLFGLPQDLLNEIEICVSDNASSYLFKRVVEQYTSHANFKYQINEENVGFDQNVLAVTALATGQYVMLLGNDDMVIAKGLSQLLNLLRQKAPDALFANYLVTTLGNKHSANACRARMVVDGLTLGGIFKLMEEKVTFMSSITLKRSFLEFDDAFRSQYIGKHFVHIAIILNKLKQSRNLVYSPCPATHATDRNKVAYNVKQLFLGDLGFILNSTHEAYGDKPLRPFRTGIFRHVILSREMITRKDLIAFNLYNAYTVFALYMNKMHLYGPYNRLASFVKNRLLA